MGWGSGVVGDSSGESGLSLDTTRVCLEPLGCHGYDIDLKFSCPVFFLFSLLHWAAECSFVVYLNTKCVIYSFPLFIL